MKNGYVKLIFRFSLILAAVLLVSRVSKNDTSALAGEYAGIISSETPLGGFAEAVRAVNAQKAEPVPADKNVPGSIADLAMTGEGCDSNGEVYVPDDDLPAGQPGSDAAPADAAVTDVAAGDNTPADGTPDNVPDAQVTDIPAEDTPDNTTDNTDDSRNGEDAGAADDAGSDEPGGTGDEPGNDPADGNVTQVADGGNKTDSTPIEQASVSDTKTPAQGGTAGSYDDTVGPYTGMSELELAMLRAVKDESYKQTQEYVNALLVTHKDHYNADIVAEALSLPLESNDARYEYLTGMGYKAYTIYDAPTGFTSDAEAATHMITIDVPVWKMTKDGRKYSTIWPLTINSKLVASVRCIFSDIYQLDIQFPFNYLKGYMYRKVGGSGLVNSKLLSIHSFGAAMDINFWDPDNDYYLGKGNDLRNKDNPYCIPESVIEIFANYGWNWGGNFDICVDSMHFQYFGLEFLQYSSKEPFPILDITKKNMNKTYVRNLTQRLKKLGYLTDESDEFTEEVDTAVKAFEADYSLEQDGIVDYETWVPLINATHDMSYVF
jgi:hypothetical protein